MAQPPWDKGLGEFFILHFTYGNDYDENGVFTPGKVGKWRFDKRSYMAGIPPKNLDPPPRGCDNELVKRLIEMMNEAIAWPWTRAVKETQPESAFCTASTVYAYAASKPSCSVPLE